MTSTDKLKYYPALYAWAILCFVPTLFYFYVGEEAVYTLNSIEMWQNREFMNTVMYGQLGGGGGRPPLVSWLMIPVANFIGWENVLVASRIVTVAATITTSLIVGWLAQQLWSNKQVSWTAAMLYLVTADILLYRGWLAYADPLFTLFVVLAIALAWVSCLRSSYLLLTVAMIAAFAAFLAKAFTIYVFLGVGLLVLQTNADFRRFLFNPKAWIAYLYAVLLPFLWLQLGPRGETQQTMMYNDILRHLVITDVADYLVRLVRFPAEMLARLMPATLFIGYFIWKQRKSALSHPAVRMSLLIALLNFLPYLISPEGIVRYVLPSYAFVVLAAAYLVMQEGSPFNTKKWIVGMLVIGSIVNLLVFPYYQKNFRGENYVRMAQEIQDKYGQYPLYVTNFASTGLAVVANIDTLRLGKPALIWPPDDFKEGIVIAHAPDDVPGQLLREININGDSVYLICRGAACGAAKN